MSELDNVFSVEEPVAAATATAASADKKAKLDAMKKSLKETISADPTYTTRLHTWSDKIEVANSLGWGDNGNIVLDSSKKADGARALTTTSVIVGYRVKNTGSDPIPYTTEVYAEVDGKWVPTKVDRVLAPGAYADLTRQFMTMLCAQPEISFTLANGKVIRGSSKATKDLKAELEAYYFSFNKDLGIQINADEVKLNVGEKIGDRWVVKPEFTETFGYLNNTPERAVRGRKVEHKYSSSDLAANFVMKLLEGATL